MWNIQENDIIMYNVKPTKQYCMWICVHRTLTQNNKHMRVNACISKHIHTIFTDINCGHECEWGSLYVCVCVRVIYQIRQNSLSNAEPPSWISQCDVLNLED